MARLQVESRVDEAAKVHDWRVGVCLRLGYDVRAAERIARSEADLRALEKLLDQGCPPLVAKKIVV